LLIDYSIFLRFFPLCNAARCHIDQDDSCLKITCVGGVFPLFDAGKTIRSIEPNAYKLARLNE